MSIQMKIQLVSIPDTYSEQELHDFFSQYSQLKFDPNPANVNGHKFYRQNLK